MTTLDRGKGTYGVRVLHVTMTGTLAGAGVRRHLESLVPLERGFGIETSVVMIEQAGGLGRTLAEQGVDVYEMCCSTGLNIRLLHSFWQLVGRIRPSLIHLHSIRLLPLLVAGV